MKQYIPILGIHLKILPYLVFIGLVFLCSESLFGREKSIGELIELSRYNALRVHFRYDGVWIKPTAPINVPTVYEATIRSYLPLLPSLRNLFACKLAPVPPEKHPGTIAGVVSIDLFDGYDIKEDPTREFEIRFFLTRKEVLFDGKLWKIDDSFWIWLNENFAFSGIDIHLEDIDRGKKAKTPRGLETNE